MENGILHQRSCVNTPQQNAIVERKDQHILNVARSLRFQAHLPLEFWGHCVMHVVFLINGLPSPVIDLMSPYKRLYGNDPDIKDIRVFGCLCYAATLPNNRHKMAHRGKKCIFISIPAGIKGYLLYDLEDRSCFVSRDVTFYESHFPMADDNNDRINYLVPQPSLPNIPSSLDLNTHKSI